MEKECYICDTTKKIEDFYKNQTRCKSCTKEYARKNKQRIKEYKKEYREKNKERINEKDRKYYLDNKERLNERNNEYYHNNKEMVREIQRKYREKNKDILSTKNPEYSKKYYNKNKNNEMFLLIKRCRSMIGNSLRMNGYYKTQKTEEILGCSFDEFKSHLESKFEDWMNWDNRGLFNGEVNYGWDIDHIIPLDTATSEEDIINLNHYTNLQPLCSFTNRHIKMDKVDYY